MLSIVKGVSRNRNISEFGIGDEVCIYVNIFSSSCPLVGCTLWLLASMYSHILLLVASLFIWSLRVVFSSVKLSNVFQPNTCPITSLPVVSLPTVEHMCLHVHSMCCLSVVIQQCACL